MTERGETQIINMDEMSIDQKIKMWMVGFKGAILMHRNGKSDESKAWLKKVEDELLSFLTQHIADTEYKARGEGYQSGSNESRKGIENSLYTRILGCHFENEGETKMQKQWFSKGAESYKKAVKEDRKIPF